METDVPTCIYLPELSILYELISSFRSVYTAVFIVKSKLINGVLMRPKIRPKYMSTSYVKTLSHMYASDFQTCASYVTGRMTVQLRIAVFDVSGHYFVFNARISAHVNQQMSVFFGRRFD